jgi:hypothetical protein
MDDTCVSCGAYAGEGRHICVNCENGCKQLAVDAHEKSALELLNEMQADADRFFKAARRLIALRRDK